MILVDNLESPSLMLFGCSLWELCLKVEFGFISMGLKDRDYNLYKYETQDFFCTVKIPTAATRLPMDIACILADEEFTVSKLNE